MMEVGVETIELAGIASREESRKHRLGVAHLCIMALQVWYQQQFARARFNLFRKRKSLLRVSQALRRQSSSTTERSSLLEGIRKRARLWIRSCRT
jgi:hypothetical protein